MTSIRSSLRSNVILSPLILLVSSFTSIYLIRFLGPRLYAEYATFIAILSMFILISDMGCNSGVARYLNDMFREKSRLFFYKKMILRRWFISAVLVSVMIMVGPYWVEKVNLSKLYWNDSTFIFLGTLGAITLHSQLASSALMACFMHSRVIIVSQFMTIIRASLIVLTSIYSNNLLDLIKSLIFVGLIELIIFDVTVRKLFCGENLKIESKILNKAQKHGLVSMFDKLSTSILGYNFLLILLSGYYSRYELAIYAAASEIIQKVLGVVSLPISNMVVPILNESVYSKEKFNNQVDILGGISICFFSTTLGLLIAIIPKGMVLLLGPSYASASLFVYLLIVPIFVEAVIRMVWGAALLTLKKYRWIITYNFIAAFLCLFYVLKYGVQLQLINLIVCLGLIRFFMGLGVLIEAYRTNLINKFSIPFTIILFTIFSGFLSVGIQEISLVESECLNFLFGILLYTVFIIFGFRFIPLIPQRSYEVLCYFLGTRQNIFKKIVPIYIKQKI